jgi:hypothetical protein
MYVTSYANDIHLYTTVGAALTAKSSGNIGIGITTPASALHVNGQSLWLTGGNGGGLPAAAGGGLRLYYDGVRGQIFAFDYPTATPRHLALQDLPGANVGSAPPPPPRSSMCAATSGSDRAASSSPPRARRTPHRSRQCRWERHHHRGLGLHSFSHQRGLLPHHLHTAVFWSADGDCPGVSPQHRCLPDWGPEEPTATTLVVHIEEGGTPSYTDSDFGIFAIGPR